MSHRNHRSHLAATAAALAILAWQSAAPARAAVTKIGDFKIEYKGSNIGPYGNLDTAVMQYMAQQTVHAAQLAVRSKGVLIFSHAYTMGKGFGTFTTKNGFRLASISKMLVTAAYSQLLKAKRLTGSEKVYDYLGISAPLLPQQTPDPRSSTITVAELYAHTSGLPGSGAGDPLFEMRDVELQLGQEPLTGTQFAQYLYGLPLNANPGQTETYSNVGYVLLSQVIAKAAGMRYDAYIQKSLLKPLHLRNWTLSPTLHTNADPNEVFADAPYTGRSVFDLSPNAPIEPFNFEGGDIIWELTAGPTDYVTNAESVSAFIHTWAVYGLGGRLYDYARDGCMPGASTWAESLNADVDFALLFNKQPCLDFSTPVIQQIEAILRPL